jgi:TolB protein
VKLRLIYKSALIPTFFISLAVFLGCTEETFVEPKVYGSLKGQVLGVTDKKPVKDVVVRITTLGKTISPDDQGYFSFDSIPVGKYSVTTSVTKYKTDVSSIEIEQNKTTNLLVLLNKDEGQNKSPQPPVALSPASGAKNTERSVLLSWKSSDEEKDTLRYSVILFKEGQNTTVPIATDQFQDTLRISNLDYESTYYWQVIVKDSVNRPIYSEVFSFTTKGIPEHPYVFARVVDNNYQIFSSDSTETIQLTNQGANWRPVASPNRQRIAFISNRSTEPHIYIANTAGRDVQKATTVPLGGVSLTELSFCWSPDGTELLYPSYDKLYAVRPDGTGLRIVARAPSGRFFAGCDWTSQGNKIVAKVTGSSVYDNELYLINPTNGGMDRIVSAPSAKMSNPHLSADGKLALYTLDMANFQNNDGRQLDSRIFVIDLATRVATNVSTEKVNGSNDIDARFSPNNAKVIFTNTSNDGFSVKSVFTMNADGTNRLPLLTNAEMPCWK